MAEASQGASARGCCVEQDTAPHTFDTLSEPYEFTSESLQKGASSSIPLASEGLVRIMSPEREPERMRLAVRSRCIPRRRIWTCFYLAFSGADEVSDVFALAESLPAFGVLIDRVAETFQYTNCKVNTATFRGSAGGLVELMLQLVGMSEITGTAFPAVTLDTTAKAAPYVFSDGVLTLQTASRQMMDFELVIDNGLSHRFTNSQTAASITPQDRTVTLKTTNPFTAAELDLYGQTTAGAAGSLVLTNGAM